MCINLKKQINYKIKDRNVNSSLTIKIIITSTEHYCIVGKFEGGKFGGKFGEWFVIRQTKTIQIIIHN